MYFRVHSSIFCGRKNCSVYIHTKDGMFISAVKGSFFIFNTKTYDFRAILWQISSKMRRVVHGYWRGYKEWFVHSDIKMTTWLTKIHLTSWWSRGWQNNSNIVGQQHPLSIRDHQESNMKSSTVQHEQKLSRILSNSLFSTLSPWRWWSVLMNW